MLDNFKFRHGIRQLEISREKLSANREVAHFKEQLNLKISELNLIRKQVYKCDETGLNWKALSQKTLALLLERAAAGFKIQKDWITAVICANASGNHTAITPACNTYVWPVNCYGQKTAGLDQRIIYIV